MPPGPGYAYQQRPAVSGQRPGQAPMTMPGRGQSLPPQAYAPGYPLPPGQNAYGAPPYPSAPRGPASGEYIILRPQVRSGSLQVAASSNQSFDAAMAAYRAHEVQRSREQPRFEDLSDHDSDEGRTEAEVSFESRVSRRRLSRVQIIAVRMARASATPSTWLQHSPASD